jgi:hypothetical protein
LTARALNVRATTAALAVAAALVVAVSATAGETAPALAGELRLSIDPDSRGIFSWSRERGFQTLATT